MIDSCTLVIKTPSQPTTLNVMAASCDLFDVSMDNIQHGKFTSRKVCRTTKFPVIKLQFTTIKVSRVITPIDFG